GLLRILGLFICLQHILHFGDVVFIEVGHAPHFSRHGLRSWWRSSIRMVSLPTFGTSRRLTASSTTSRTVQRARPSGGSLQNHRDDALLLPVIQHFGCSRPLLLVECAF